MTFHLNKGNYKFLEYRNNNIYVDKTPLLGKLNGLLHKIDRFLCLTRPERFGKTMTLSMINAYYSKGCDSKEIFDKLDIAKDPTYLEHLNKHNVIWIDMCGICARAHLENKNFVDILKRDILDDLASAYPDVDLSDCTIAEAFMLITGDKKERFVFLIDEWDIPFRDEQDRKACRDYIMLLRSFFKSSDVSVSFELVYMTGTIPIIMNAMQSGLNNFDESTMVRQFSFNEAIGYTDDEVKELCKKYDVDFAEMKEWYYGYELDGIKIYNPYSVNAALEDKEFNQHWTLIHPIDTLTNCLNYENGELKAEAAMLLSGDSIPVNVRFFDNVSDKIFSKNAALTALIHLGYLAYDENKHACRIANYEISHSFILAMEYLKWNEISDPISNSTSLIEKTMAGDTSFINEMLNENHKKLASIFGKNREDVLDIILTISYFRLREFYYVRKEDTCTTGRADIIFMPKDKSHMPIVVTLQADDSSKNVLKQIKERDYSSIFKDYKGKVLLVGISYNSWTLRHDSKIEYIDL